MCIRALLSAFFFAWLSNGLHAQSVDSLPCMELRFMSEGCKDLKTVVSRAYYRYSGFEISENMGLALAGEHLEARIFLKSAPALSDSILVYFETNRGIHWASVPLRDATSCPESKLTIYASRKKRPWRYELRICNYLGVTGFMKFVNR